jgi:alcohol dehydrogenase class IV
MHFEFATAAKIIFGAGKLNSIGGIVDGMGKRILILSGGLMESTERLMDLLDLPGLVTSSMRVSGEPTVEAICNAVDFARQLSANLVIGIGGGSTLDTAKATAALIANPGQVTDYLEVIGQNKPLTHPSMPLIAIPTTAGTGAEVTRNAVIGVPDHHVKVSIRSPYLLPRVALVDPELTLSVPPEITAYTGFDALTQLIEPFTCGNPNPLTDAICIEGLQHVARSFIRAYDDGSDLTARSDMALASLFSGLALANAKLGAVHGLAGPIGGEVSAHHGAICAGLLPRVMETNFKALINRSPNHPSIERYAVIGRLLTGNLKATAESAIQWVKDRSSHMNIQALSAQGLAENRFPALIDKAKISSSMKGNPIILFDDEIRNILRSSL